MSTCRLGFGRPIQLPKYIFDCYQQVFNQKRFRATTGDLMNSAKVLSKFACLTQAIRDVLALAFGEQTAFLSDPFGCTLVLPLSTSC